MPKIYKFKNLDSAQATITELAKSLQTDDIILYTDSNSYWYVKVWDKSKYTSNNNFTIDGSDNQTTIKYGSLDGINVKYDLLRAGHIKYDNKNINIDNLPTFNSIAKSTDQKTISNFKSKLQGIQGVQNISSSNSYWGFSYWGNSYWGL